MSIPLEIQRRIEGLPIESVAEKLGIQVNRHKAHCFMHDDSNPSLSFSVGKNIYYCFACNKGGNPIKLVRDYEKCSFEEACRWLAKQFGIEIPGMGHYYVANRQKPRVIRKVTKIVKETKEIDVAIGEWVLENSSLSEKANIFLYEMRKYNPEVVKELGIGSISDPRELEEKLLARFGADRCYKSGLFKYNNSKWQLCFSSACLLFPYYHNNGVLYSIQARYFDGPQRFDFPPNVRQGLFNAKILDSVSVVEPLYISEGVTDCIALLSSGRKAVAFPSGSICHDEDIRLLASKRLFMYPDRDRTGEGLYTKLCEKLKLYGNTVKRCELPGGFKDFSEYYRTISK